VFDPKLVFQTLYKDIIYQMGESRVIAFEGSSDVVLISGFIKKIESQLQELFKQLIDGRKTPAEIHRSTLRRFVHRWHSIKSSSTCFPCLRRRPQYHLECGHIYCENCVIVFGDNCKADPWIFKIHNCFLCEAEMPKEIVVMVHPPTAGAGVLCIDGGGARGVIALKNMQRIQDRIGLPMPLQRFFKVIVGTSSGKCYKETSKAFLTLQGGLSAAGLFVEGWTIEASLDRFEKLAKVAFTERECLIIRFISWIFKLLGMPFVSSIFTLWISFLFDGLYPAEHIEAALKEAFGDRRILDYSYATSIGARVGLLVATVCEPSRRLFTNYNGVGVRDKDQGKLG
jgi:hypothetical protein